MAALILLLVLIALGAMSCGGLTVDSRDPSYGLGPVLSRASARRSHQEREAPGGRGTDAAETS
jgi:hypothetical protein